MIATAAPAVRLAKALLLRVQNRQILIDLAARSPQIAAIFGNPIAAHCDDEGWRAVVGESDRYEVSSCGRVRSLVNGGGLARIVPFLLKPNPGLTGSRLAVRLSSRTLPIHKVVAESFIGQRPEGMTVNHINGDFRDNHARNLEYLTLLENVQHAWRTGLMRFNRGEQCYQARLTDAQAAEIIASPESGVSLARRLGVTVSVVSNVRSGRTWRHLHARRVGE